LVKKPREECKNAPKTIMNLKRGKNERFVKRNQWNKLQDEKKMEPITAVYNYSNLTLTEYMTKVLNRGFNF
jgi:hypothetical protein